MTKEREDNLMEALRAVVDPEIGLEIVELGLIRTIEVDDEKNTAVITMIIASEFDMNQTAVTSIVAISTLLSPFTIAVAITLLGL